MGDVECGGERICPDLFLPCEVGVDLIFFVFFVENRFRGGLGRGEELEWRLEDGGEGVQL